MPVPIVSRRLYQPFDLGIGQVFSSPDIGVALSRRRIAAYCPIMVVGGTNARRDFAMGFNAPTKKLSRK
jgi:hypothetical protein